MKKINIFITIAMLTNTLFAQQKQGNTVAHIIKQGETIVALAKQYNVSKADIFKTNNLDEKTILRIGQKIIIHINKSVDTKTVVAKPVIDKNQHLIESGESLSRISKKYNVTEQEIKEWNNLSNDNIRAGNYLYISNPQKNVPKKTTKEIVKEVVVVKEIPKKVEPKIEIPKPKIVEVAKEIVKETPKKIEPIIETPKPENKEIVEIKKPVEIKKEKLDEGVFSNQFDATNNSIEGVCGVFKTITGWHDKKYYVLLNNAENGSIVKVIANNKFVYAKVLGPLPNIKEDKNITMRISNAAAAVLGIADNKFNAKIEF